MTTVIYRTLVLGALCLIANSTYLINGLDSPSIERNDSIIDETRLEKRASGASSSSAQPFEISEPKYQKKADHYIRKRKDAKIKNNLQKLNAIRMQDVDALRLVSQIQQHRLTNARNKAERTLKKIDKSQIRSNLYAILADQFRDPQARNQRLSRKDRLAFRKAVVETIAPGGISWLEAEAEARMQLHRIDQDDLHLCPISAYRKLQDLRERLYWADENEAKRKINAAKIKCNQDRFDAVVNKDAKAARRVAQQYSQAVAELQRDLSKIEKEIAHREVKASKWEDLANEAHDKYAYPGYNERLSEPCSPIFSQRYDSDVGRSSLAESGYDSDYSRRINALGFAEDDW